VALSPLARAGLDALRDGNYSEAIFLLESACVEDPDGPSEPVQLALAEAFRRDGQDGRAFSLFRQLSDSRDPQIADRARDGLAKLHLPARSVPPEPPAAPPAAAPPAADRADSLLSPTEAAPEAAAAASGPTRDRSNSTEGVARSRSSSTEPAARPTAKAVSDPSALPTLDAFEAHFRQHLRPRLADFEKHRKLSLLWMAFVTAATLAVSGVIVAVVALIARAAYGGLAEYNPDFAGGVNLVPFVLFAMAIAGVGVGVAVSVWGALYSSCFDLFASGYQRLLMEDIIDFVAPLQSQLNVREGPMEERRVTLDSFNSSGLLPEDLRADRVLASNRVSGVVAGLALEFADIWALRERAAPAPGYRRWVRAVLPPAAWANAPQGAWFARLPLLQLKAVCYRAWRSWRGLRPMEEARRDLLLDSAAQRTVFQGLLFLAEFGDLSGAWVTLLPAAAAIAVETVPFPEGEFSRQYAVCSNKPAIARQLLDRRVQQRLLAFSRQTGRPVLAAWRGGRFAVAIPSPRHLLEPCLLRSTTSIEPAREYFSNLRLALGLTELLDRERGEW